MGGGTATPWQKKLKKKKKIIQGFWPLRVAEPLPSASSGRSKGWLSHPLTKMGVAGHPHGGQGSFFFYFFIFLFFYFLKIFYFLFFFLY
jgi:hypothetical protein